MFNEIPALNKKGLRDFGLMTGGLFAAIFGLALPYLFGSAFPLWPWVVCVVLVVWALVAPLSLNPVYRVWMRVGLMIGSVMSRVILGLVFFLVVTPIGIMMRATGKDPMNRALDDSATSYREDISERKSNDFDKPF